MLTRDKRLKVDIDAAISWGCQDHESRGYTSSKFIEILIRARNYIEFLEKRIPENERYMEYFKDI